jgi:hypothetical protein
MKWTIKLAFEAVPGSPIEQKPGIRAGRGNLSSMLGGAAWLFWYDRTRMHSTLNHVGPVQFEQDRTDTGVKIAA